MGLILRLAVCLTLHGIATCQVDRVTEPVVYSRFDYDYKMLTKIIELEIKQKELLKTVEELRSRQQGSSYIRWGKSSCPDNGTTLVYHGYVAGTSYDHSGNGAGAGADYLCLSAEPVWGHYKDGSQNGILVSGVTYEFNPYQKEIQNFFGKDILRQTAACSLCRSHRSTTVMIPGRNRCVAGWTEEYRGYLATGYPGYSDSSEFICIDERPDSVINTAGGSKDNLLYFVETKCGLGLPCPPYVDGRELPCVVCSL